MKIKSSVCLRLADHHAVFLPWIITTAISLQAISLYGQGFTDAGFEEYIVSPGDFLKPTVGVWTFGNDAGVVSPYAPNSSTGALYTWSATFDAVEGQQYASTYAGVDYIRQVVPFNIAGDYRIYVYAAAPSGAVTIPPVTTPRALGHGAFTFTLADGDIGNIHAVSAGSSWGLYSADFAIATPGSYELGVRNTLGAPYFINFDAFGIQFVPEPSTIALGLLGGLGLAVGCRQRKKSG